MRSRIILGLLIIALTWMMVFACKRNFDDKFEARATTASPRIPACQTCDSVGTATLSGVYTANRILSCDTVYLIDGKVFFDDNAVLTIPAGTVLKGVKKQTAAATSALVITKGSRIDAKGTKTCPIVFTSDQNKPAPGDWGGVVLLGKAPTNQPNTVIVEGIDLPSVPAGVDISYGGNIGTDTSGTMTYCRIEYAGAALGPDNELNGLTCGGVGSGTKLDYIEVYMGNDDAFEFFGGTVNATHLIAFEPDDDAFDFDFGYRGCIQFAVSVLSNDTANYSMNPNGIESDNNPTGACITPETRARISNMTVVGVNRSDSATAKGLLNGANFRRQSDYMVANSIFMGYPTGANLSRRTCPGAGCGYFKFNIVHGYTTAIVDPGSCAANNTSYTGANPNNLIKLADPFNPAGYDFRPVSGSPALIDTSFAASECWTKVGYRGAFASGAGNNWMHGWAKIPTVQ